MNDDPAALQKNSRSPDTEALGTRIPSGQLMPETSAFARAELAVQKKDFKLTTGSPVDSFSVPQRSANRRFSAMRGVTITIATLAFVALSAAYAPRLLAAHHLIVEEEYEGHSIVNWDGKPFIQRIEILPAKDWLIHGSVDDYSRTMGISQAPESVMPWRAFLWHGDSVTTTLVDRLDATQLPIDWRRPESVVWRARASASNRALFIFRESVFSSSVPAAAVTGRIPGVVLNKRYRDGWTGNFELGGRRFKLEAHAQKGANGQVIDGSLRLEMVADNGMRSVVLGGAAGHVFKELRVMWAGELDGPGMPAFYIRRTLVTGEIDHVLSVASRGTKYLVAGLAVDPDLSEHEFSSGVGESEEAEVAAANAPGTYPEVVLPETDARTRATASPSAILLQDVTLYSPPERFELDAPAMSVPERAVVGESKFSFGGKSYRITVERRPTYAGGNAREPTFSSEIAFGSYTGGAMSLIVWLHQGDRRQALLVTSTEMDSGMSLSAGDFDGSGTLTLSIDYYPHYNNGMTHVWKLVEEPGRLVKRVRIMHSQGC